MSRSPGRSLAWLLPGLLLLAGGCSSGMQDLQAYIDEVRARPGGSIEPLPEIRPAPAFAYSAAHLRSPFVPDVPARASSGIRPQENRTREYLEQFPLDSMRMVGTLQLSGQTYGLVQTQDGRVHRVLTGHFLGQNDGRIVEILDGEIRLQEIVADGLGGYLERPAAMALRN